MTIIEMKNKIAKYKTKTNEIINWNNTFLFKWEFDLLKDIGAISDDGIIPDTPVLRIKKRGGEEIIKSYNGDISKIKEKIDEINATNSIKYKASMKYMPFKYPLFYKAMKEIEKQEFSQNIIMKGLIEN